MSSTLGNSTGAAAAAAAVSTFCLDACVCLSSSSSSSGQHLLFECMCMLGLLWHVDTHVIPRCQKQHVVHEIAGVC
jgi:hypothetical protein